MARSPSPPEEQRIVGKEVGEESSGEGSAHVQNRSGRARKRRFLDPIQVLSVSVSRSN